MSRRKSAKHGRIQRRIPRTAAILAGVSALILATVVAIIASSTTGTLALWNDGADIPEASITVGSAELSIAAGNQPGPKGQAAVQFPASTFSRMLPGDVLGTPVTVTNRGTGPVSLQASLDTASAAQTDARFALREGGCVAGPLTGTVLSASPSPLGDADLAPGASRTYCLQSELSSSVAATKQGTSVVPNFTLSFSGTTGGTP
ncbi:hypothetical protein G7068_07765 [Leucobacter viscericola]|uniref:SipW-cognate class signal peptide n=1 Tax=Leucobacter viscericola TaxID=2714935 RepID=A0A6G7XFF3_9MICO|nr:hypothetical protein [Leucobacter viscericola]QIK63108.1 hypothetical protein G7068_07765 [Leucobacter viscericola]